MDDIKTLRTRFLLLKDGVGLKLLRRGGRKAGLLLRDKAAEYAPRGKRGRLQGEMTVATKKETATSIQIAVGPSRDAWYGRIVEGGAKAHVILPKRAGGRSAKWLSKNTDGASVLADRAASKFFGGKVNHPGFRARPFLSTAIERHGDEAAAVFSNEIDREVKKAFEKQFPAA